MPEAFSSLPEACYRLLERLETPGRLPVAVAEILADIPEVGDAFKLCEYHDLVERLGVRNYEELVCGKAHIIFHDDYSGDGVPCLRITPVGVASLAKRRLRQGDAIGGGTAGAVAPVNEADQEPAGAAKLEAAKAAGQPPQVTEDGGLGSGEGGERREPEARAFLAYRLHRFSGKKQEDIAPQMGVNQSTVSRWISAVKKWCEYGNPLPDVDAINRKIQSMDPKVIELGQQIENRTRRQPKRRTED